MVAVTVTNTGQRPSREVVQLYFQPADRDQPVRLVGWEPLTAAPGEAIRLSVRADPRMWRRWDTAAATWRQLPHEGQLLLARGLGDIRHTLELKPS
jgi:beta-glucosidase